MISHIYYNIWRPAKDTGYCTSRYFSNNYFDACLSYVNAENALRKYLSKATPKDYTSPKASYYKQLKSNTFLLQDYYLHILRKNGIKYAPHIKAKDFYLLEAPMKLRAYTCTITILGEERTLSPFAPLPHKLDTWYLEGAKVLRGNKAHQEVATLENLIQSTAALRCLLYAQFGPQSDASITNPLPKGEGTGYFQVHSLFHLTPPQWPEEEHYSIEAIPCKKDFRAYRWSD